ncbi:MAG: hypothetical protein ACREBR_05605 [bacterium]
MATNDQVSQEYLLVKCFLYKYSPEFSPVTGTTTSGNTPALSTFTPFSVGLDNTKFFTKYDISQFVASYSFEQHIDETTFSWSLELQDLALSYATLNKLKVLPPNGNTMRGGLSFSNSSDSLDLLSKYETNANTFANNDATSDVSSNPILNAKFNRGKTPGPLTAQNFNISSVQSTVPGLRLSDLIQEYDFISVFLYKNTTPLTNIWGVFTVDDSTDNNPLQIFNYKVTSDVTPAFQSYQNPLDPFLQYETVLLTKMPTGQTLFSNEFNGFVVKKNVASSTDQVDRVTVAGNGWSRLFGATRRSLKPSLFQNSLYEAGQVLGASDVSAFETVYAGRTIPQIIKDLFDLVYKIDFNSGTNIVVPGVTPPANKNNSTNLSTSTQTGQAFTSPLGSSGATVATAQISQQLVLENSFYNLTSLVVANAYPANLFTVPQYLLASTMKLRPFAYIEPINMPASSAFITGVQNFATNVVLSGNASSDLHVTPEAFQVATQNFSPNEQVLNYNLNNPEKQPVFVEPNLQNLVAYFQFLGNVFESFSPDLETPYEILNQIRNQAFVEIYEQPSGQFIVRSPQYNNMSISVTGRPDIGMIRSSNLNIITTNYGSTVENLITKLFAGYSPNITPISTLQQFGYCDGKLLIQNGLLETITAANPNAATASISNTSTNNSKTTGIFGYAEYLQEVFNAKLKTGTLTCDLDNSIQVGLTFFDETKFKFGYIVGVTKQVSVTGTATMGLTLSYVRDAVATYAVDGSITAINTDLLPVLTDIENSFATGS